jgi:hypothetical protein
MSFKVVAAVYGTLATASVASVGVAYHYGQGGHGGGSGSYAAVGHGDAGPIENNLVPEGERHYVDDKRFRLVLPYDPFNIPQGSEDNRAEYVTWFRTRAEAAAVAQKAAELTGDSRFKRIAEIERALVDNDPKRALKPAEAVSYDDRRFALVLPYDPWNLTRQGGRDQRNEVVLWYRTREEAARAAAEAARVSADARVTRIAEETRRLADREAAERKTIADRGVAMDRSK